MAVFCPLSTMPVHYNGRIAVGARVEIYLAETNTPKTAYSNGALTAAYPWDGTLPLAASVTGGTVIRVQEALVVWEYGNQINTKSPPVAPIAKALNLTPEQVNNVFAVAAGIQF